ncbi:hypothetical protein VDS18_17620 [Xanthomonas campestris pv. campestris]|nr:hypothetical protein [Xanthomonas campestris pv. campestris]
MIGSVLQFEDMQSLCRPGERPRLATVEQWARRCGIRYHYDGKGGIWTTTDALNAAIGLTPNAPNADCYSASDLL